MVQYEVVVSGNVQNNISIELSIGHIPIVVQISNKNDSVNSQHNIMSEHKNASTMLKYAPYDSTCTARSNTGTL